MNQTLSTIIGVLLMSTPILQTNAQGIIFYEDFDGLIIQKKYWTIRNKGVDIYKDWTTEGGLGGYHLDTQNLENHAIHFVDKDTYATTSSMNRIEGNTDVILTFTYFAPSYNVTTFDLTINGGGTFEDGLKTKSITTPDYRKEYRAVYRVNGATPETTFTFKHKDKSFAIDDLYVLSATMPLAEKSSSNAVITAYKGLTTDVTLSRTFHANIWNTVCLPFDVDASLFEGYNPQFRLFKGLDENELLLDEADYVSAGTPFLLKINQKLTNPTFSDVEIKVSEPSEIYNSGIGLVGVFSKYTMSTAGNEAFLGLNGELMKPMEEANILNGTRAFFRQTSEARVNMDNLYFRDYDKQSTDVKTIRDNIQPQQWYTLDGVKLSGHPQQPGLYIGKTKKGKIVLHHIN